MKKINLKGASMKEFYKITIGELIEIKKISKMTIKEATPKIIELQDKHELNNAQVTNLVHIAQKFNPTKIIINA